MSRGSYVGGHTIIRANGSFGSYDPAETKNIPNRDQKKKPKRANRPGKVKKPMSLPEQRKFLLNLAADARVSNRKPGPKFPKNITIEMQEEVARTGSIDAWAATQTGFAELVKSKIIKKALKDNRKSKSKSKSKTQVSVEIVKKKPHSDHKSAPDTERIAFLKSEIAQAQAFIRQAEKEIDLLLRGLDAT